ncbi:MAG: Gfo/Idh/MocA family oxidoreductase [Cytophagales bacterium]|nr:Gfo/Idh/MocA family oxidoreductase [Armatimonadota bacterium]
MSRAPGAAPRRFVLIGAGFWGRFQLAAWGENPHAVCVGVCDQDRAKAEALGGPLGIPAYEDPAAMLADLRPDFADIVTPVHTHVPLIRLCAEKGVPVICQKPLAASVAEAEQALGACQKAGVSLLVHENWRWQTPLRTAGAWLKAGRIGAPFRARLSFVCSFAVFDNQPSLAALPQFILTDIGSHVLDVARSLFGEAASVYAQTQRLHPNIRGEDVATVVMPMGAGRTTVTCEMSYASRTEHERFPQTYLFVEGEGGSLEVGPDYLLRVTDASGTHLTRHAPPRFAWADPAYDLVQASMVPCQADLLAHLRGEKIAETVGADNLETLRLVFAAYESAATGTVVRSIAQTR